MENFHDYSNNSILKNSKKCCKVHMRHAQHRESTSEEMTGKLMILC
jgi:hypothetical protein